MDLFGMDLFKAGERVRLVLSEGALYYGTFHSPWGAGIGVTDVSEKPETNERVPLRFYPWSSIRYISKMEAL